MPGAISRSKESFSQEVYGVPSKMANIERWLESEVDYFAVAPPRDARMSTTNLGYQPEEGAPARASTDGNQKGTFGFSLDRRNTTVMRSNNSTDSEKTRRMSSPGVSGVPPMPTAASAPDLTMMKPMPTVDERMSSPNEPHVGGMGSGAAVGPARYCSPRHRMLCNSRNE